MKKRLLCVAGALCAVASVFAYNPPFGGEDLYRLTSPQLLAGGASASGGPVFTVIPASITYNPALTATEQRSILNLSGNFMFDTDADDGDATPGGGFQLGISIPTKFMVFSGSVQGLFCKNPRLDVGNSIVAHLGLSKDVTDKIFLGINLYTGFYFGSGSDFTIGADLGFLYRFDDMGFLKEPRIGVSLLNLGKPITGNYSTTGINSANPGESYPGIVTPRVSFAGTLISVAGFKTGFSTDLSSPTFQNLLFDVALGMDFRKIVNLNVGWNMNLRELMNGGKVNWPSVGINFKFGISSKSDKIKESWKQSELSPSVGWQCLNGGLQNIAASASLYLGMQDKEAPTIILWDEQ